MINPLQNVSSLSPHENNGNPENTLPSLAKGNSTTFPLIAIDGGATKTLAAIVDEKGTILGTGKSGASNYQVVGFDGAIGAISEAISTAILSLKEKDQTLREISFQRAVFALAGIDTADDYETVKDIVKEAVKRTAILVNETIVENDALSALLGATDHQPGILLISGTGSIAFAYDGKGTYKRSGGFGHLLGDEGSGYWIGMQAIRSILKMHDGRGPNTVLSKKIIPYLHLKNHEELQNWVYGPDFSVDKAASLSVFVAEAAATGDLVSKNILNEAVEELLQLVTSVAQKANLPGNPFTLVLLGGILENMDAIRDQLIIKINELYPEAIIRIKPEKPINLIIRRGLYRLRKHA